MRYFLTVGGLFAAVIAIPAHAAPDSADVAQCVVDNDMPDVQALLNTVPGSSEERRAGVRVLIYYGGCDDNRTATGDIAWRERAEIANAALLSGLDRARFDAASPPPRARWALTGIEGSAGYSPKLVSIRQFGDCVVALAPANALRLARSPTGSADEAAAIDALQPALSDCIAPGQRFALKRADMRLVLAEPLYHMIVR